MATITNKKGRGINAEAIDLVNVNVSAEDYDTRSPAEHFGLILPVAGTLKIKMLDGGEDSFSLPAGYNPIAAVKVSNDPGNTITQFIAYY
jgi:hypothetical protein